MLIGSSSQGGSLAAEAWTPREGAGTWGHMLPDWTRVRSLEALFQ